MNRLDRLLAQIWRIFLRGGANRPAERAPAPAHPQRGRPVSAPRATGAYIAAVVLSFGAAAALIPLRDVLDQSISLLMVVPVLIVALLGGVRLGTVSALAAAAAFDLFHTVPYYHPTIDDSDDIVETVTLLAIGIVAGLLADSAKRSAVAARVRGAELDAVTRFLDRMATPIEGDELTECARASVQQLLGAIECEWAPGYGGTASPVLRPDGGLTTPAGSTAVDEAGILPPTIEIPVGPPGREHGRFLVRTSPDTSISIEERGAAVTIANTLGRVLEH